MMNGDIALATVAMERTSMRERENQREFVGLKTQNWYPSFKNKGIIVYYYFWTTFKI